MNAAPEPQRHRELWSLGEDTAVDFPDDHSVLLSGAWGKLLLEDQSDRARAALRRLPYGPVSLRNIVSDFPDHDSPRPGGLSPESLELAAVLDGLQPLLIRSVDLDGVGLLLSVVPLTRDATLHPVPVDPELTYRCRPLSVLQYDRNSRCMVLESELCNHRAELRHKAAVRMVQLLYRGPDRPGDQQFSPAGLAEHLRADLPPTAVRTLLAFLVAAGLATADRPIATINTGSPD